MTASTGKEAMAGVDLDPITLELVQEGMIATAAEMLGLKRTTLSAKVRSLEPVA